VIVVLQVIAWIVLFVLAYVCGSIPFGLVIGKLFYHVDVREHGSGNVGTTNVMRVLGKKAGVAVLVCDMLKGYIPAIIATWLFGPWPTVFIAAAPVVGHVYSIFLKGKGGKGIATGAAVVLALVPLVFGIILIAFLVLLVTVRYVSVASLTAATLVPILAIWFGEPLPYEIAGVLVAALVWWAHRGNIQRLANGTEHRARMPWTRDGSAAPGREGVTGGGGVAGGGDVSGGGP
jgi:glycerol-3-phosphate acyltransferase PlsY